MTKYVIKPHVSGLITTKVTFRIFRIRRVLMLFKFKEYIARVDSVEEAQGIIAELNKADKLLATINK